MHPRPEPFLGAPEGHASQVVWLRGGDSDREGDAPSVRSSSAALFPWSGRENVFTVIGGAVLDLAGA